MKEPETTVTGDLSKKPVFLTGRLLARNAGFNLVGEIASFAVGGLCIPFVIRRLGTDSFGILSIAWTLLSYISLFDLGLSRATTKFVAESVSTGEQEQIPSLVWTSITLQVVLGILGSVFLATTSHILVARLFKVSPELTREAERALMYLALAVPIVLISNCLRGVLEAMQRFDLTNSIKIPVNILMFATPLFLIPLGGGLPSIIAVMTLFRFLAMLLLLRFCWPLLRLRSGHSVSKRNAARRLIRYGGWITLSSFAAPLLLYADRFAISALISVGALAYYSGPADMVNRFLVIPACLGSTLFPAFSSLHAAGAKSRLEEIYGRALKYTAIAMGPLLLLIAAFSGDILQVWLGPGFAHQGTTSLQILAIAVFINGLGVFPGSLLHGVGRPDLTAIFHVAELPLHLALVWLLVSRIGITGAAIAVIARLAIDVILLLWACGKYSSLRLTQAVGLGKSFASLGLLSAVVFAVSYAHMSLASRVFVALIMVGIFYVGQWCWALDLRDQQFLRSIAEQLPFRAAPLTYSPNRILPESD